MKPNEHNNVMADVAQTAPYAFAIGLATLVGSLFWPPAVVQHLLWVTGLGVVAFVLTLVAWWFQSDILRVGLALFLIFGHQAIRASLDIPQPAPIIQPAAVSVVVWCLLMLIFGKRVILTPPLRHRRDDLTSQ